MAITINDTEISKVLRPTTKFLGVNIDYHLTWCDHVRFIAAKIAKNIGVLGRTAYLLPSSIRLTLFYSLVYPYLSYCNMIWAFTYDCRVKKIVILQKRAIRIIAGTCTSYCSHTAPLFVELNLLKFHQKICPCSLTFKI